MRSELNISTHKIWNTVSQQGKFAALLYQFERSFCRTEVKARLSPMLLSRLKFCGRIH
ncbi:hypothetical protein VDIAB_110047 [Vibrio diabolicus]|nr:hypothetical protein VDIAB_110047 [Vibrio diabolicus]